jgi:hypothetical protein
MEVNVLIEFKLKGGKTLTLKKEEADELYNALKDVFEPNVIKEYVPYYYPQYPQYPYIVDNWWTAPQPSYKITYGAVSDNTAGQIEQ